jgi:chromosome segregation ATPase
MNPKKLFNSFAQSYSKDTGLISTTARINMNNTSTSGFFKLSTSQNLFDKNYSKSHLSDLKKTFYINIDILKQFISSNKNNKDNELISLLNSLIEKAKKKSKIIDKIKEKKSKILIDNQIITDKRSKIEEKNFYYKNKIKENEERLDNKEEYMKVLHKKMREVEIYIHKNTVNLKNFNRKKKYQSFSMFNFVETNNELIKQKKELNKVIENTKNNYKVEMEENKQIKQELKNDKENNLIEINQEEIKIKKLSDKYKSKIKLMKLRINMLRNNYNKLNKKIKILKLDEFIPNIDNNKKDDDDIKDLDQIPLETSINMKNSYMDFSVLNTQNFDDNNISKFDAGNVSKIGIYDISIINQN